MKKFASYIAGIITGMLIVSVPIFADSYTKSIEALLNFTTIKINGTTVESDNFVYNDKTYVWIRDVANIFGKEIEWDQESNTANIVDEIKVAVATVDGTVISTEDVNITSMLNPNGATVEEIIQNAIDYEIEFVVTLKEAAKNGYEISEEIKLSAQSYIQQLKGYVGDDFYSILESNGLTEKKYTDFIEKNMSLEKFSNYLKETTTFSEDELLAKYNELKDKFEIVTAKHILIMTDDKTDDEAKAEIEKIYKELSVDKFDKLMSEYSEDVGSKDNVEGMVFGRGQMVPEFENASFTQEVGVIGKPIKTAYGYHIVLVTNRSTQTFEEAKDFCIDELFADWYKNKVQQWKNDSDIVINQEVLDSLKSNY